MVRIESLYLLLVGVLGLVLCGMIPPFAVPDEGGHFLRAEAVSQGQLWPRKLAAWGGGSHSKGLVDTIASLSEVRHRGRHFSRHDWLKFQAIRDGGERVEANYGPGGSIYTFVPYVPSALVLGVSKKLGIPLWVRFYLGRLANLIVAAAITFFAIRLFPGGRWPLVLLGALPLTVQQYASYSADALTLSVAFLAVSLIVRQKGSAIVALCVLAWIKFPYTVIALGLLPSRWWRLIWVPALAAVAAWAVTRQYIAPHHLEAGYPVSVVDQMRFVQSHPFSFVVVCLRTVWEDTSFWFKTLFTLGYVNIYPGDIAKYGWSAVCLYSLGASHSDINPRTRWALLLSVVVGVGVLLLSQYLMWTALQGPVVCGPVGRYFIPFLACALLPPRSRVFRPTDKTLQAVGLFGVLLAHGCSFLAALGYYGIRLV